MRKVLLSMNAQEKYEIIKRLSEGTINTFYLRELTGQQKSK